MLSNLLKSVKLFLLLFLLMLAIFSTCIFLLKGTVIHEAGVLSSIGRLPVAYRVTILGSLAALSLLGLQTALCRLLFPLELTSTLMHLLAGASILLAALFSTVESYTFTIYPGTFVKVGKTTIALEDFRFDRENMNFDALFTVKRESRSVSSHVSYNSPLISKLGNVWVLDVHPGYYGLEVQAKYQPFSTLPFLLLFTSSAFLLLLIIKVAGRGNG